MDRLELNKTIKDLYNKPTTTRSFIVYTGLHGMYSFNWALLYGDYIKYKYFTMTFKKIPNIKYLSLFTRHGAYKLKIVKSSTFHFFEGTKLINTIYDVINPFFIDSGNPENIEVKDKMSEVNSYIKTLEYELINSIL